MSDRSVTIRVNFKRLYLEAKKYNLIDKDRAYNTGELRDMIKNYKKELIKHYIKNVTIKKP